ncbi:MAG: hypothetical protein RL497_2525 [Pseudomonadota bacterium]
MSLHTRPLAATAKTSSKNSIARWWVLGLCVFGVQVMAEETKRCSTMAARLDSLEGQVQWQAAGENQWHTASLNQTFCYGDMLVVREKRAALRLSNNTLVRLNEHSSLKLIPPDQGFWVELIDGAAHFLTRTPKSFTVKAPYVNAAVEGTEFLVTAENGINQIGVIEGKVRSGNPAGSVLLTQGQSTTTASQQQAPSAAVVLKLNDFVSWAMYFPPLPNRLNVPADIKTLLDQQQDEDVILRISQNAQASAETLSLGAALALNRGDLLSAQNLVQRALTLNPKHPDAQAIAALIDLGRGEVARGQQRAAQNVLDNPFNPTALIAHSYSQQGQGLLQGALDSALEAQRITPNDSQITARVAELYLALGKQNPARQQLDQALSQTPNHSRLLTFKGFSLLAARKGKQAEHYFAKASSLDSADPYAHLGWGMALIQQGQLEAGREHLELAVVLDPANSLLRSYLGKGYFEENRLNLAATQLNLAQTLDPNDPTPWYYLSQVKHSQNQFGDALQLIETSIDKNANRAVYREGGALDSDAATRLADKARIYQAMGAQQHAISTASDAIRAAPNDYAGHRAMALALTGKEGAQTARANEALQASLLAPIGATPLAPGFAETAMQVLPGAGPHEMGINEYNAAYTPNGINGFVSALGAGNNTRATEGQVQLVGEKTDLSLGQYHYSSDGFKENNDRDYLVNEAKFKYQVVDDLLIQLAAVEREDDLGDLSDPIVKEEVSGLSRKKARKEDYSVGFNYSVTDAIKLIGFKSKKHENLTRNSEDTFFNVVSKSVENTLLVPETSELIGSVDSGLGIFYAGYKKLQYASEIGATFDDVIDGEQQDLFVVPPVKNETTLSRYFVDYLFANSYFSIGLGVEGSDTKSKVALLAERENFVKGGIGFNCLFGFECYLFHDEFVSLPFQSRDSLRTQWLDVYAGRTDYLPFSMVKLDGMSWGRDFRKWGVQTAYQQTKITSLKSANNASSLPNFEEQEYSAELWAAFAGIDAIRFEYHLNKSKSVYGLGVIAKADVPNEFDTEIVGVSVMENVLGAVALEAEVSAVKQNYILPIYGDESAARHARVRLVNLDINARCEVGRGVTLNAAVLNVFDNSKPNIEGFLAGMSDVDGAANMDGYFTERVLALSVKLIY